MPNSNPLEIQVAVLYYYITDETFRYNTYQFVTKDLFLDNHLKTIFIIAYKLVKKYNTVSFGDIIAYLKQTISDEDKQKEYFLVLDKIKRTNLSKDYVIDELKGCYINSQLEHISDNLLTITDPFKKLDILRNKIFKLYNNVNELEDRCLTKEDLYKILQGAVQPAKIVFPVDLLNNNIGGGISAGDLGIVAGYTSVGKTWFLLGSLVKSIQEGRNVIFITLEMTLEQILPRLAVILSNKQFAKEQPIPYFHTQLEDIQEEMPNGTVIDNIDDVVELLDVFLSKTRIVEPARNFSVSDIENEINKWEYISSKPVDGVIIDGLECINVPYLRNKDAWQITAFAVKDLKALARTKKIAILTMAQVQKTKETKPLIRLRDIAGGAEIARASSIVLTLNQTEEEYKAKCMRVFVAKHREGMAKNSQIVFNSLFSVGKFVNPKYLSNLDDWLKTISTAVGDMENQNEVLDDSFEFEADNTNNQDEFKGFGDDEIL